VSTKHEEQTPTLQEFIDPFAKLYNEEFDGSARRFKASRHNPVKYLFKGGHEAGFEDRDIINEFCRQTGAKKDTVLNWSKIYNRW